MSRQVARVALDKDNSIHNEPIPVTEETILNAIKAAYNEGRLRKAAF